MPPRMFMGQRLVSRNPRRHTPEESKEESKEESTRIVRIGGKSSASNSTLVTTSKLSSTWKDIRLLWARGKFKSLGLRILKSPGDPDPASSLMVSRNLLAFRSITTLLAFMQQRRVLEVQKTPEDKEYLLELKVANAVSTIVVVMHEVTAVSFKRTIRNIDVVTYAHPSNSSKASGKLRSTLSNSSNPPVGPLARLFGLCFAANARRDDPQTDSPFGEISEIVATHDGNPLTTFEDLCDYIEANCFPGHVMTLPSHIFVLKRIFCLSGDKRSMSELLRTHVANTCYFKILRRLTGKLSEPFIKALEQINQLSNDEFLQGVQKSNEYTTEKSKPPTQNASDKALFSSFIADKIDAELKVIRDLAQKDWSKVYTAEARKDFHAVLVELLQKFIRALHKVNNWNTKFRNQSTNLTEEDVVQYKKDLKTVELASWGLQYICKGSIFKVHLRAIEPLLCDFHPLDDINDNVNNINFYADNRSDDDNNDGNDEELKDVQPSVVQASGQPIGLWKSYNNWLRLMLVHFDAAVILAEFFSNPELYQGQDISTHLLSVPPADGSLLPLEELLRDPILLPVPANTQSTISNEDICRFFINANPEVSSGVAAAVKEISENWNTMEPPAKIVSAIEKVNKLTLLLSSPGSGWSNLRVQAGQLSIKLTQLFSLPSSGVQSANITNEIDNAIKMLGASTTFLELLGKVTGKFKGAPHCEAILASLLDNVSQNISINSTCEGLQQELIGYGRVIGVSKRCCPACHHLLSLLADKQQPFLVRGSHNTISPCTLPAWLPDGIVHAMNRHFGELLRTELLAVMDQAYFRPRTKSISSANLSDLGHQDPDEDDEYDDIADSAFENSSW